LQSDPVVNEPFGGLIEIFVGDPLQLKAIVSDLPASARADVAFHLCESLAFADVVVLNEVKRQKDGKFKEWLRAARMLNFEGEATLSESMIEELCDLGAERWIGPKDELIARAAALSH
jgi:hypothetical protein